MKRGAANQVGVHEHKVNMQAKIVFWGCQVVGGPRGPQPWRWGHMQDRNGALQHVPPLAGAPAPSGQVHRVQWYTLLSLYFSEIQWQHRF